MRVTKTDPDLKTVVRQIEDGELDLQPDFQRGEVWDSARRVRLIDTILRNWYVPAVHIIAGTEGIDVVLDGQQRLAAIRDFFAGRIKVNGNTEPPDPKIHALHGLTYQKLPADVRRAVDKFSVSLVQLSDHEPQEPNELFFRLNQSYNLTPPEKRNALHGEARNQVKALVEAMKESGLLTKERIGFNNNRLAYDDVIARACVAIELNDMRKHINNNVVEAQYRTGKFADETISTVASAGELLLELVDEAPTQIRFNKGTLQTWLVYCAWAAADDGELPRGLLAKFESLRGGSSGHSDDTVFLGQLMALYEDRASYRVTDVSSVLIRDLVVHLISQHEFDTAEKRDSARLIDGVSELDETKVLEYLALSNWGAPIMGGH